MAEVSIKHRFGNYPEPKLRAILSNKDLGIFHTCLEAVKDSKAFVWLLAYQYSALCLCKCSQESDSDLYLDRK